MRKTFEIEFLKNQVNDFLVRSPNEAEESRRAMMTLLENVLGAANSYNGFRYLNRDDVTAGYTVGINTDSTTRLEVRTYEEQFKDTDTSRVQYF